MSKNAIGIGDVLTDFRRELVLVRKYGNAPPNPRNEGFTRQRVFFRFLSKISVLTSDNKHYHLKKTKETIFCSFAIIMMRLTRCTNMRLTARL